MEDFYWREISELYSTANTVSPERSQSEAKQIQENIHTRKGELSTGKKGNLMEVVAKF